MTTTLFRYKRGVLKNEPTRFVLVSTNPDLLSGVFKAASGETRNMRFSELVAVPAAPVVKPQVTWDVRDYNSTERGPVQVEDLHPDVSVHEFPTKLESVSVTVDNGRLGIDMNGQCIFYTPSLTDGVVTITRTKKATK